MEVQGLISHILLWHSFDKEGISYFFFTLFSFYWVAWELMLHGERANYDFAGVYENWG